MAESRTRQRLGGLEGKLGEGGGGVAMEKGGGRGRYATFY